MATPRDLGRTDALPPQAPAVEQRARVAATTLTRGLPERRDWDTAMAATSRTLAEVHLAAARPAVAAVTGKVVAMPVRSVSLEIRTEYFHQLIQAIESGPFYVHSIPGVANRLAVSDAEPSDGFPGAA